MNSEILDCPFCGSEAELFHQEQNEYHSRPFYFVGCMPTDQPCDANGPERYDKKEAVAFWNAFAGLRLENERLKEENEKLKVLTDQYDRRLTGRF